MPRKYAERFIKLVNNVYLLGIGFGEVKQHRFCFLICKLLYHLDQGCQTHFHQGSHQPHCCLQRAERNFRTV